ncbi:MAG: type II CRISPR RNA-guided endonuclease Cas9, partial [Candidatus Saccharibacteria bacterium]|nr:type II CRISPR RNA-guided endonuclease Cas9 [Candidatus Saccharibacteria bacterium]
MSDNGKPKYFVGLDCGTSSVGWAVTDENYKLLRRRGKTMWGMRLFDEASTAAERRSYRSVRRRLARRRGRIRLLQQLFSSDIASVDPDFYIRLRESIYLESDKRGLRNLSKNTLFNDSEYTDKDYHNEYPTIWHLRKAIIESASNPDKHFDIRLYYLAIEHIIKHRGHFLREGKVEGAGNFADLYDDLANKAKICNIAINEYAVDNVESLLKQKISKTDKKKQLSEAMFADVDNDEYDGDFKLLAHMLCGSSVNLNKLFNIESDEDAKIDFSKDDLEEKLSNISDFVSAVDGAEDLILAAKQIYDYIYLSDLLAGNDSISAAMVANYDQHQKDLAEIKAVLKPFDDDYRRFFKQKAGEGVYYNAYIGKGSKDGGKKAYSVNQEAINKELRSLFEKHGIGGELLKKAEDSKLLPKQRGFAKGTIPQQLHHNELEIILQKLIQDYPSFGQESADEDEAYNTKAKKIASIHSFRIPYYCGPMRSKAQPNNEFCWADEEIEETVYPWNYNQLVDLGARASKFIDRMTNECTYIAGAQVLPKCSLMYQRYMVLNELNNLKINGCRIDNDIKQQIFNQGYLDGELSGNITLKKLSCWMKTVGIMDDKDELGGTADHKALPRLNTHYDFYRILGDGYNKRYSAEALEQVVKLITILNNERKMLANKIRQTIDCTEEQARRLAKLNYKDWGRFSAKFLSGIRANINGQNLTILEALWETPNNLMELLSDKYEFVTRLDEINQAKKPADNQPLTYEQVDNLYCSPAVKRTVWQTIKIINEIRKVMGYDPAKVFIEMTRGNAKGDHKVKLSRRKDLLKKYEAIKDNQDEFAKAFSELNKKEDRDLQSKKLFLYFQQGGKCAYTGERIEIEEINNTSLYDIDHIYPRSKTKDDSLSNNLVLVKAEKNREKTNIYPISDDIRAKMHGKWALWRHYGLITKEKYERLTRATPLTADELAGFIARQIVETSQSTKAICDLLKRGLDNTQVVTVKAGGVSDLRHYYGYNATNPRPEF